MVNSASISVACLRRMRILLRVCGDFSVATEYLTHWDLEHANAASQKLYGYDLGHALLCRTEFGCGDVHARITQSACHFVKVEFTSHAVVPYDVHCVNGVR